MKRTAVLLVSLLTAFIVSVAPAHADQPECYTVPRLPDECLTLATYTYITGLENFRDHLIGQLLNERAEKQAAQVEVNTLRQELLASEGHASMVEGRNAVLRSKLEWRKHLIVRLWHTINRLR